MEKQITWTITRFIDKDGAINKEIIKVYKDNKPSVYEIERALNVQKVYAIHLFEGGKRINNESTWYSLDSISVNRSPI